MSDGWSKHTWRNEWNPIESSRPQVGQRVEVWVFIDSIPAVYCADGRFRTQDGREIANITHWRNGPAQTDGLLAPGEANNAR